MKEIKIMILDEGVSSAELMNKINGDNSNERTLECFSHEGQTLHCRTTKNTVKLPLRIKERYGVRVRSFGIDEEHK